MKTITVKRTESGVVLEGRVVDLVIFADVVIRLAEHDKEFPMAANAAEVAVKILAAMINREPEPSDDAPPGLH